MTKMRDEDMVKIRALESRMREAEKLMNELNSRGYHVRFSFSTTPDGKQTLALFQVLAPVDINSAG